MRKIFLIIFTSLLMAPLFAGAEEVIFIVNAENPVTELRLSEIRDYYFKKRRRWPFGESVRFIDRNSNSHLRDIFVKNVLKKSNSDIELFWIGQKLYSGDSAPLKENTDSATIQFVAGFKGAIGYVSAGTSVTEKNVKAVRMAED